MNPNVIEKQKSDKKKHSRLRQRRAVADIISTMLLMGVTVTGASTLTYFMNDAFVTGTLGTATTLDSSSLNVLLLAYDTRDASSLLSMNNISNKISNELCGSDTTTMPISSCTTSPVNSIPANDGTEFIVFQIQNNGLDPIFLEDVVVNDVVHPWDSFTSDTLLDASVDDLPLSPGRSYPADGMFSIVTVDGTQIQHDDIKIQNGETANILVKLGSNDSDIKLSKGIQVKLDIGKIHLVEFILESGDAR